jgi:hypothetical protein
MAAPTTKKPPTQTAGVQGIAATPIVMNKAPAQAVPWPRLAALPPFQMFAAEHKPGDIRDSEAHALAFARETAAVVGDLVLLEQFKAWHAASGYWPKEDHTGKAL